MTEDKEKAKLVRAGLAYFEKLERYREDIVKAIEAANTVKEDTNNG